MRVDCLVSFVWGYWGDAAASAMLPYLLAFALWIIFWRRIVLSAVFGGVRRMNTWIRCIVVGIFFSGFGLAKAEDVTSKRVLFLGNSVFYYDG